MLRPSSLRNVFTKRPEFLVLLTLEVGFLILADLFQLTLVLVALDFSTWLVLPWAFYDKLEQRNATKQLRQLKKAQLFLFVSGCFFLFYVIGDLASEVPTLDPFILGLLPLMLVVLFLSGFFMLMWGLYDAFRVVNHYSNIGEGEKELLIWAAVPFIVFNAITMFVQLYFGISYYLAHGRLSIIGWFYITSVCVALVGTALTTGWLDHIGELGKRIDLKGLVAAILLILPYILLTVLYFLNHLGISLV